MSLNCREVSQYLVDIRRSEVKIKARVKATEKKKRRMRPKKEK